MCKSYVSVSIVCRVLDLHTGNYTTLESSSINHFAGFQNKSTTTTMRFTVHYTKCGWRKQSKRSGLNPEKGFFSTTLLTRVARGFTAVVQPVDKWSRLPPSVQLNFRPRAMRKGWTSAENEEPRIN